ncbi:MAG: transketolase [bacterium]
MENITELRHMALQLRKDIVKMIHAAGSGHPGGSLSMVEILTALFFKILNKDPRNPAWEKRDRFVLSKGHGVPALYAALARSGYFPVEDLMNLRKLGSPLQGHPDYSRMPAVEASTGSLGQGLSIAIGIALAARQKNLDYHTFCLVGDGESDEGQIWEAAMFASHHKLSNLTAIIDYNKFQLDGPVDNILDLEPFEEKWQSFSWKTIRIDGHDIEEVVEALQQARTDDENCYAIVADTVKGSGVSFMENDNHYHGVAPDDDELEKALAELQLQEERLN